MNSMMTTDPRIRITFTCDGSTQAREFDDRASAASWVTEHCLLFSATTTALVFEALGAGDPVGETSTEYGTATCLNLADARPRSSLRCARDTAAQLRQLRFGDTASVVVRDVGPWRALKLAENGSEL